MVTLPVEKRSAEAPKALRRRGRVPAIVYGAHQASVPITVDGRVFEKVRREAGEASIVTLSGLETPLSVLIHEVDVDPITGRVRHIDFYAVTKGEKIEVGIPLMFVGTSEAVLAGANLIKVMHELEVKADPMQLPHAIDVDISALGAVDDRIYARDIALPRGVDLVTDADDVVALAQAVQEEKAESAPVDLGSIEVEKKGKTEEAPAEA